MPRNKELINEKTNLSLMNCVFNVQKQNFQKPALLLTVAFFLMVFSLSGNSVWSQCPSDYFISATVVIEPSIPGRSKISWVPQVDNGSSGGVPPVSVSIFQNDNPIPWHTSDGPLPSSVVLPNCIGTANTYDFYIYAGAFDPEGGGNCIYHQQLTFSPDTATATLTVTSNSGGDAELLATGDWPNNITKRALTLFRIDSNGERVEVKEINDAGPSLTFSPTCFAPGATYEAVAHCGNVDSEYADSASQTLEGTRTPSISVNAMETGVNPGEYDLTASIDYPYSSSKPRSHSFYIEDVDSELSSDTSVSRLVELNCSPSGTSGLECTGKETVENGSEKYFTGYAKVCSAVATDNSSLDNDNEEECSADKIGDNSILPRNGNASFADAEALPGGGSFPWIRKYNSRESFQGVFGYGWASTFDSKMTFLKKGAVEIRLEANQRLVFDPRQGNWEQIWPGGKFSDYTFGPTCNGCDTYKLTSNSSGLERTFEFIAGKWRLTSYFIPQKNCTIRVNYANDGHPLSIVEETYSNWTWLVTWDMSNNVIQAITVAEDPSIQWNYNYDVFDDIPRLASVNGVGVAEAFRTYEYQTANDKNNIVKRLDALGNALNEYTYNSDDRATSYLSPNGEHTDISYDRSETSPGGLSTTSTFAGELVSTFSQKRFNGRIHTVGLEGGCQSCATNDARYAYDQIGRKVRFQDSRGFVTLYEYDDKDRMASSKAGFQFADCPNDSDDGTCDLKSPQALEDTIANPCLLIPTSDAIVSNYDYADGKWLNKPTQIRTTSVFNTGHTTGAGCDFIPDKVITTDLEYDEITGVALTRATVGWTRDQSGSEIPETRTTETGLYNGLEGLDGIPDPNDPSGPKSPEFFGLDAVTGLGGNLIYWAAPQPKGLVKYSDGTRDDLVDNAEVKDFTFMAYYPIHPTVPPTWQGRLAAVRNAAGHKTIFKQYDVFGNAQQVVDPNGVVSERLFNSFNQMVETRLLAVQGCNTSLDPLCGQDVVSNQNYAPGGGPLRTSVEPDGDAMKYSYDDRGRTRLIERGPSLDNFNERILRIYDDATGKVERECTLTYDPVVNANGKVIAPQNPGGTAAPPEGTVGHDHFITLDPSWLETKSTSYEHDKYGRLKKTIYPITEDHQTVDPFDLYEYDQNNNILWVQDAEHSSPNIDYLYDSRNRLISVTQLVSLGVNATTSYSYDIQSNLNGVTDANNNTTSYVVDDFGQTLEVNSPVTGLRTSLYDKASNLIRTEDAAGAVLIRQYDELNRIISEDVPSGGSVITGTAGQTYLYEFRITTTAVTWNYDDPTQEFGIGRVTNIFDQSAEHDFVYERRGLLAEKTVNYHEFGGLIVEGPVAYTMRQEYDIDSNPIVRTNPSGVKVFTDYDWADRPSGVSFKRSGKFDPIEPVITEVAYAPFGPMIKKTYDNGWKEDRLYDQRYFLDQLSVVNGAGVAITDQTYIQDNVGNITDITDLTVLPDPLLPDPIGNGRSGRHFIYDDLYRLTNASATNSAGGKALYGDFEYTLDNVGNRLAKIQTDKNNNVTTDTYTYFTDGIGGGNNSILEKVNDTVSDLRSNTYDLRGQPISDGNTYYWYDNRQRLLAEVAHNGNGELRHLYDYSGKRAAHFGGLGPFTGGQETVALSAFWGNESICEEQFPLIGGQTAILDRIYFAGSPVAIIYSGGWGELTRVFLHDHLGTNYLAGDSTGDILWRGEYTPFGEIAERTTGIDDEDPGFRFPGQELDDWFQTTVRDITPLYYNVNRYYDPEIGRYTQPDPIGLTSGPNIFSYSFQNPISYFDPIGLSGTGISWWGQIMGVIEVGMRDAKVAQRLGASATTSTNAFAEANGLSDTARLALRHCNWQCQLINSIGGGSFNDGETQADEIGRRYEKSGEASNTAQQHQMALKNNRVGRNLASQWTEFSCGTPEQCWDRCIGALKDGSLYVEGRGGLVPSNTDRSVQAFIQNSGTSSP